MTGVAIGEPLQEPCSCGGQVVRIEDHTSRNYIERVGSTETIRIRMYQCTTCKAKYQNTVDLDAAIHRQSHSHRYGSAWDGDFHG